MVIAPRLRPRNAQDIAIGLFVALPIQLALLFALPFVVAAVATRSLMVASTVVIVLYALTVACTVRRLTLTSAGIEFHRLLGSPRRLTWTQITSVELAPRWELIGKGWLWPPLPAREATLSFTSVGHYRIAWTGGYCYYPPADPATFERAVSERRSRAAA